jgi:thiamine biosynthesis lipoprotein
VKRWTALCSPTRLVLLVALASAATQSSATDPTTIALTGRAMGTTWSAKFLQSTDPLDPTTLSQRISSALEHLESIFSTYRPASELSRFNISTSTGWQPVSPELARVAAASRDLSALTDGAFDGTVAPLSVLWGFGSTRRTATLPTDTEIAAARARVDYLRLEVRLAPPSLRKSNPLLSADFSSMAKGFAADSVSELLSSLGATDHLVQIGGDIKTGGTHVWRTGVSRPTPLYSSPPSPVSVVRLVSLAGTALSTSGDAQNSFIVAGRHYGHLIDPRTGHPASSSLASVSVIHPSCAASSALATALFVLGPDAGFALAVRERLACLFTARDGTTLIHRATPEWERYRPPSSPAQSPRSGE